MISIEKVNERIANLYKWHERNPLKLWRISVKMTRIDAANIIGVSAGTVSMWEKGSSQPSAENWIRISDTTGISLQDLKSQWNEWLNMYRDSVESVVDVMNKLGDQESDEQRGVDDRFDSSVVVVEGSSKRS